jgi:hypothetical protein
MSTLRLFLEGFVALSTVAMLLVAVTETNVVKPPSRGRGLRDSWFLLSHSQGVRFWLPPHSPAARLGLPS